MLSIIPVQFSIRKGWNRRRRIWMLIFVKFRHFFAHISSYAHCSRKRSRKPTEEGCLDTVVEVWARSVQCVARDVRSKFFSARNGKYDFPGFLFEALFCTRYPPLFEMLVFCAHTHLFENGPICHNSGFPVRGQVWGTPSSKFGRDAYRVPCATRAYAVCNAMFIFSLPKKQAVGPNSLGATLSLRTQVRVLASVSFFFSSLVFCPPFFSHFVF